MNGVVKNSNSIITKKYTLTNGTNSTTNDSFSSGHSLALSSYGTNTINVNVVDGAKNSGGCHATINVDNVTPNITAKSASNNVKYKESHSLLGDYFTINTGYGPTKGITTCYNVTKTGDAVVDDNNDLGLGINKIKCVMTGNNGKTSSASTLIRHKYTTSSFTCKDNYAISGDTCKGGTGACLTYNPDTCSSWNCKTYQKKKCTNKAKVTSCS